VDADLDTLVTALYVKIDDALVKDRRPGHPARLTQSELVCLAVAQALLGFHSEHRWIRFAICHPRHAFPCLPHQPGYNKRLRAALPLVKQVIRDLAADSDFWFDTVWVADSTPVECGRSRPAVKRSDLAGWANYGYCASHSRWFWGLRLYLIITPAGMPILSGVVPLETILCGRACSGSVTPSRWPSSTRTATTCRIGRHHRPLCRRLRAAGRPRRRRRDPHPQPGHRRHHGVRLGFLTEGALGAAGGITRFRSRQGCPAWRLAGLARWPLRRRAARRG